MQQASVEVRLLDDWKGVTDPDKRRTIQNRLSKRAHRRRQRAIKAQSPQVSERQTEPESTTALAARPIDLTCLTGLRIMGPTANDTKRILSRLEAVIYKEFATGSPCADLLLGLTQLNILRALNANIDVLGYRAADMHDDAVSVFSTLGPLRAEHDDQVLPPALQPTIVQQTIPHHPWLDLIPIPKMRDNLIRAGESIDDVQLCYDLCGYRSSGTGDKRATTEKGETGVVVWKDPWDPCGWEVTESFLRRWGWIVRDCWELFVSTDMWRRKRGEKPLFCLPSEYCR